MQEFICAMNRDRDGYQVAAALAEVDALARLVTDYYHGSSRIRIGALQHRRHDLIDPLLARNVPSAVVRQSAYLLARRTGVKLRFPDFEIDSAIASRVRSESAKIPNADLLLYSNYAYKAFEASPERKKILFQYHPGARIIANALAVDELGKHRDWWQEPEIADPRRSAANEMETALADRVLCASGFTARGLAMDGVASERISIIPYGSGGVGAIADHHSRERLMLFVGQGVQRKGLHLLAAAWKRANLTGWKLRVVASKMDPEIGRMLADADEGDIEVSGVVPEAELARLYSSADVLILPSLVEGFGLVLGEALARGCRLVATDNTGLPDLALPEPLAFTFAPGRVDVLVETLRRTAETYSEDRSTVAEELTNYATSRSWGGFREGIRAAIGFARDTRSKVST